MLPTAPITKFLKQMCVGKAHGEALLIEKKQTGPPCCHSSYSLPWCFSILFFVFMAQGKVPFSGHLKPAQQTQEEPLCHSCCPVQPV